MTLLDDHPTPRPPRRTWKDLPASPPIGEPFPPPNPADRLEPTTEVIDAADEMSAAGPDEPRRRRPWLIVGTLVVAAVATVIVLVVATGGDSAETTPTVPDAEAGSPSAVATALGPAVVQIELDGGGLMGSGVGSGFVYDTSGLVLTAHHVVASADDVVVRTADDRELAGRVVGRSPERDIAVVALDRSDDLVAAPIAEPGSVEVGETAIALGSPFGFQASVTAGIISGLDRELDTPAGTLTGLIQTDAPINPGNSGGPLADADARVIGINTAIASLSGGNDGVGFAVPIEDVRSLVDEVAAAGGAEAPTVPAPENGGLFGDIPGLDMLPGLDQLPGLDELLGGLFDGMELPGLDELLGDLFDGTDLPGDLEQLLDDLFGGVTGDEGEDGS